MKKANAITTTPSKTSSQLDPKTKTKAHSCNPILKKTNFEKSKIEKRKIQLEKRNAIYKETCSQLDPKTTKVDIFNPILENHVGNIEF